MEGLSKLDEIKNQDLGKPQKYKRAECCPYAGFLKSLIKFKTILVWKGLLTLKIHCQKDEQKEH